MQNETPDFPTRLAACARQLRRHGFEAVCVADLAEAGRRLRDEIARCAPRSISYGDSMTLRATGIVEELRNGSRYEFIDGFDPALPRPEQLEVRRKGLLADFFMTGVNAVTLGGSLYWVDMGGQPHRTRDLRAAPRSAAGRVATKPSIHRPTPSGASSRSPGPKNVARHTGFRTPCAVTGLCADCNSPQRICNSRVWLERCYPAGRILVPLIDEEAATSSLFRATQRLGQRQRNAGAAGQRAGQCQRRRDIECQMRAVRRKEVEKERHERRAGRLTDEAAPWRASRWPNRCGRRAPKR